MGRSLDDLATGRLTWRQLQVLIRQAPLHSAVARHQLGDVATWTTVALGRIEHSLRVLAWQNTRNGQKGQNYPQPIPLPWEKPATPEVWGDASMTIDECRAWLGW